MENTIEDWKFPILVLIVVSQVLYFFRSPNPEIIYPFVLIDGLYLFIALRNNNFLYFVVVWSVLSLILMGFSLAPFHGILKILSNMSIIFPAISLIQVIGFVLGVSILIFTGYLFSLSFLKKSDFLERALLSFGLGLGINSFIMTILGFLFNLGLTNIIVSYLVVVVAGVVLSKDNLKGISLKKFGKGSKLSKDKLILIAISLPLLLFSLIHTLFLPETYVDSLIYGVTWSKIIYQRKAIPFIGGGPPVGLGLSSNYPSGFQLLGVFIYSFVGESMIFLRVLSFTIFLFLGILVYIWSSEIFKGKRLATLSLVVFLTIPSMILYSRVSSFYLYMVFQFSLAAYYLYKHQFSERRDYLFLASVIGGFAAHASFLGLVFLPFALLVLVLKPVKFKTILVFILLFSVTASPWYVRNLLVLGNPLWPFGGGRFIDRLIQTNTMLHLDDQSKLLGFNYNTPSDFMNSVHRLFFTYINFSDSAKGAGLRPYLTIFATPAIILCLKEKDKKFEFFVIWFLFVLAFYTIILNMFERYLTIITFPTVFLSVYMIKRLSEYSLLKYVVMILLGIIFINSLYLYFVWAECMGGSSNSTVSYMQNLGNHATMLEVCYGDDARIWEWADKNLPENDKIVTNEVKFYYINKTLVNFDDWGFRGLYYSSSIDETVSVFKANNVKYILSVHGSEEFADYPEYFKEIKIIGDNAVYEVV